MCNFFDNIYSLGSYKRCSLYDCIIMIILCHLFIHYYFTFFYRRIMKVDKTSERRTKFMDSFPELNVLVGLQVYSDNYTIDGNIPVRMSTFHII